MPFPRCKSNCYDMGVRVPLAVRWPAKIKGGRAVSDFVSLADLAPTFLEACGVEVPKVMTGKSLLATLTSDKAGRVEAARDHMIFGMERHTPAQAAPSIAGYPMRGIRNDRWLYIHNFKPDRWPAGVPTGSTRGRGYADCDDSPTKAYIVQRKDAPDMKPYYDWCFARRPGEELYDAEADPYQLNNLAGDTKYADVKAKLAERLMTELKATGDLRAVGRGDEYEVYPYYGGTPRKNAPKKEG
jgi:arylsulfatase A-like enzyme